jgi:hypothetical protein
MNMQEKRVLDISNRLCEIIRDWQFEPQAKSDIVAESH